MPQPLERFVKLTLAAESALLANDLRGFRALIDARAPILAALCPAELEGVEVAQRHDARLQTLAKTRMESLRERVRRVAHINRTVRSAVAAQAQRHHLDLAG